MNARSVSRSQALLISSQAGRLLLFLFVTSLFGRQLSPGDFGFVALVTTVLIVAREMFDIGSSAVATRRIACDAGTERPTLAALLAWRRLMALVLAAAIVAYAATAADGDRQLALLVLAGVVYVMHQSAYHVVFQVRQAYEKVVLLTWCGQVAFVLACLAALRMNASGAIFGVIVAVRELAVIIGSRMLAGRMLGYRIRAAWFDPGVGPLLRECWVTGVAGVAYKLVFYGPGIIVWVSAAPEAMGSFAAAQRLIIPLSEMAWLYATPLIAALSAAGSADPAEFRHSFRQHLGFVSGISATVCVAGIFVAPFVLLQLYGDKYASGPLSAVDTLRWMMGAGLFAIITPVVAVGALAHGRERSLAFTGAAGLAMAVIVIGVSPGNNEAEAAAIAQFAGEALVFTLLLLMALLRREIGWGITWIVGLLPAALLAVLLMLLQAFPWTQFAVAAASIPAAAAFLFWQNFSRGGRQDRAVSRLPSDTERPQAGEQR